VRTVAPDLRVRQCLVMTRRAAAWALRISAAIRSKNWFWRAAMRHRRKRHENFFIAKNRDSESAQRAVEASW
jgi:hypothetical protein